MRARAGSRIPAGEKLPHLTHPLPFTTIPSYLFIYLFITLLCASPSQVSKRQTGIVTQPAYFKKFILSMVLFTLFKTISSIFLCEDY